MAENFLFNSLVPLDKTLLLRILLVWTTNLQYSNSRFKIFSRSFNLLILESSDKWSSALCLFLAHNNPRQILSSKPAEIVLVSYFFVIFKLVLFGGNILVNTVIVKYISDRFKNVKNFDWDIADTQANKQFRVADHCWQAHMINVHAMMLYSRDYVKSMARLNK